MSVIADIQEVSDDFSSPLLNAKREMIFQQTRDQFADYLAERGKNLKRGHGYAMGTIGERLSRYGVLARWVWENIEVTTELRPKHGDAIIEALDADDITTREGEAYAEASKRKLSDTLESWFAFRNGDWEPNIAFSDNTPIDTPRPEGRGFPALESQSS